MQKNYTIPMARISVGKISLAYKHIVVSQNVLQHVNVAWLLSAGLSPLKLDMRRDEEDSSRIVRLSESIAIHTYVA